MADTKGSPNVLFHFVYISLYYDVSRLTDKLDAVYTSGFLRNLAPLEFPASVVTKTTKGETAP